MRLSLRINHMKQLLCLALCIMITAGFVPLQTSAHTEAYSYKVTTLKPKTTVVAKATTYDYNYDTYTDTTYYNLYKISVPANGYIKIQVSSSSDDVGIYKKINKKKALNESHTICYLNGKKTYYRVLPKGTYYIYNDSYKNIKLKWTFVKIKNKTNYSRARATTIKRGKRATLLFNYRYEFDKWYKVKLTSKKKLTIRCKTLDTSYDDIYMYVFNSKGLRVECPVLSGPTYQTARLPKGTYYIRLSRDDDDYEDDYYHSRICQLSWK